MFGYGWCEVILMYIYINIYIYTINTRTHRVENCIRDDGVFVDVLLLSSEGDGFCVEEEEEEEDDDEIYRMAGRFLATRK